MWGIIPAAGSGNRIQPLAFSKELLPVGSQLHDRGLRPRAVCEYLVERMAEAGVTRICFVISPGKSDIMRYFGHGTDSIHFSYTIQPQPCGLCDSIFRAIPLIRPDDQVVIGLPDTIWFPSDGLRSLPDGEFSFLLFPVERPENYDAVLMDAQNRVKKIIVKKSKTTTNLIWGAFKLPGAKLQSLHALWALKGKRDEYIGTLVNSFIDSGETVRGVAAGSMYVDVGTVNGYHDAIQLMNSYAVEELSVNSGVKNFQEQLS
ncbi:Glucose-1-phosphate thymidylyltransferase [Chitinispirillum alkaliphilum]|nr:Glucose-1-phosphate thymidylyltransferase [Chitinispirillum alkaliphilum]